MDKWYSAVLLLLLVTYASTWDALVLGAFSLNPSSTHLHRHKKMIPSMRANTYNKIHKSTQTPRHTHTHIVPTPTLHCQQREKRQELREMTWEKTLKNSFYLFFARRDCDWIAVKGTPLSGSTRLRASMCVSVPVITSCMWHWICVLNGQRGDHCRVCAQALMRAMLHVKEYSHVWSPSISQSKRTSSHTLRIKHESDSEREQE